MTDMATLTAKNCNNGEREDLTVLSEFGRAHGRTNLHAQCLRRRYRPRKLIVRWRFIVAIPRKVQVLAWVKIAIERSIALGECKEKILNAHDHKKARMQTDSFRHVCLPW